MFQGLFYMLRIHEWTNKTIPTIMAAAYKLGRRQLNWLMSKISAAVDTCCALSANFGEPWPLSCSLTPGARAIFPLPLGVTEVSPVSPSQWHLCKSVPRLELGLLRWISPRSTQRQPSQDSCLCLLESNFKCSRPCCALIQKSGVGEKEEEINMRGAKGDPKCSRDLSTRVPSPG